MPRSKSDLIGRRFGRLTVVEYIGVDKRHNAMWRCVCDCGGVKNVSSCSLNTGKVRSCGCLQRESGINVQKIGISVVRTHGDSRKRLYRIWKDMRRRTTNPHRHNYMRYGGRGIRVCQEWTDSYESFKSWALSHGYDDGLSIERIDNDGDYCPENCRWATKKEQSNNRSTSVHYTHKGKTAPVTEWAEITGVPYTTILNRMKRGVDDDHIFDRRVNHG